MMMTITGTNESSLPLGGGGRPVGSPAVFWSFLAGGAGVMAGRRVLMVDDDVALCALACDYLRRFEFEVAGVYLPSHGLRELGRGRFDAAVVDVMMPEMDGFAWVRQVRARGYVLPILMLSARGEVTDRVVGLETGADDYLPKPFEPRELAARLAALCRRAASGGRVGGGGEGVLLFEELRLHVQTRRVEMRGVGGEGVAAAWGEVYLTAGEFRMLAVLAEAAPAVVSRDELSARLHGVEYDVADRSLDIAIRRVRQKLGDSAQQPRFVQTVHGAGYAFIGRRAEGEADAL